jgi:hypothetical protein
VAAIAQSYCQFGKRERGNSAIYLNCAHVLFMFFSFVLFKSLKLQAAPNGAAFQIQMQQMQEEYSRNEVNYIEDIEKLKKDLM